MALWVINTENRGLIGVHIEDGEISIATSGDGTVPSVELLRLDLANAALMSTALQEEVFRVRRRRPKAPAAPLLLSGERENRGERHFEIPHTGGSE